MSIILELEEKEKKEAKKEIPEFGPGDTVKIFTTIVEGGKERTQPFEGVVIKRQGGGLRETFTVRKVVQGTGIERTIPLFSPRLKKIKVLRRGKVRRAKLYYLRDRVGTRATKIEEKKS